MTRREQDTDCRRSAWPAAIAFCLAIVAVVAPWTGPRLWVLNISARWYHDAVGVGGLASVGVCLIGCVMAVYLPKSRRTVALGLVASAALQSIMALVEFMRTASDSYQLRPDRWDMAFYYQYPATATIALSVVAVRICRSRPVRPAVRRWFDVESKPYAVAVVLCGTAVVGLVLNVPTSFVLGPRVADVIYYIVYAVAGFASVVVASSAFFAVSRVTTRAKIVPILLAFSALALTTSTIGMARSIGPTLIGPASEFGIRFFFAILFTTGTTVFLALFTDGAVKGAGAAGGGGRRE